MEKGILSNRSTMKDANSKESKSSDRLNHVRVSRLKGKSHNQFIILTPQNESSDWQTMN